MSSHRTLGLLTLAAASALLSLGAPSAQAGPEHDHSALRAQEKQRNSIYRAWFPDRASARKAAISLHHGLLEAEYDKGYLVFELDSAEMATLQRFGFRLELASDFIALRNAFVDSIEAANVARRRLDPNAPEVGMQAIPGYACYETVEETFAVAQGFATSFPNLASWLDAGDSWEKTIGTGGYDMRVLKLTNAAIAGPKPRLLVTAAIHAREYTTAPMALEFARWLVNGYGNNADATWLLDHHEVHLLLQTNPDGRKKAEAGLSWRKNTNNNFCANTNNRGVDLNRNFSFNWNVTGGTGSSGNACDLTYRGPSASSEPETRAVEDYIRSLWPDRRGPALTDPAPADTSGIHIDLHSYSQLVLWPWGVGTTPAPNGTALQTLGRRFAWFNGYTPEQSIGLYPTDGTSDGPSYGELGVAAYTFEMGTSFFQSCIAYNNTIKPANLQALIYAAKVVRTPYLTPAGPDVTGLTLNSGAGVSPGTPVTLTASVTDTRFNQSNGAEPVQAIAAAEAYIDVPPWLPGAVPLALSPADGGFNSSTEAVTGTLATGGLTVGRHLVYVRGIDASGQAGPFSAAFLDVVATGPAITLSLASSRRTRNSWWVDLSWSGASGGNVDVYRNGSLLTSTANDGAYRDNRGAGTWTYKVCQSGSTSACSAEKSVSF